MPLPFHSLPWRLDAEQLDRLAQFHAGTCVDAWQLFGAHPLTGGGYRFAVWAPRALAVEVIADWQGDGYWQPRRLFPHGQIWHGVVPDARSGLFYKYRITHGAGSIDKADPFAFASECEQGHASRLSGPMQPSNSDAAWLAQRAQLDLTQSPVSIYEIHLGSWQRPHGQMLNYAEIAEPLVAHIRQLGFTHVELLPVTEHPYYPSWGYQVTGYFSPTARYGTPEQLRFLIEALHEAGIGVVCDWVPAHFPDDDHGLIRFDGGALFEDADPLRGRHPDWGTGIFDYGRPEVRSFLLSSADYWLRQFCMDGLRVDAVASMLYLDYSRGPGQWQVNRFGGRYHLEAISFLQQLNAHVAAHGQGAVTIAEESTAFARVTGPRQPPAEILHNDVDFGGLGFAFKWNMGWMHDALRYFALDPMFRTYHHDQITFSTVYAQAEQFVLPLSHDEVVHLKGSLLRKMGGSAELGIASLRLLYGYQWLHPGKKLLFMGQELAQDTEWNHDQGLPWHLAQDPARQGLLRWIGALNALYRGQRALHRGDGRPEGFAWVEGNDRTNSILVWQRNDLQGHSLIVVLQFTPVALCDHYLPMPQTGVYRIRLWSDATEFGGNSQQTPQEAVAWERWGRPMLQLDLPGLCVAVLERVADAPPDPRAVEFACDSEQSAADPAEA